MRDRWYAKKNTRGAYDPQVGAAAAANTAIAERAQAWNEDYFNKYVSPVLTQMVEESKVNVDRQGKLFDLNYEQAKQQADRYKTLGIPAEDRYYKMVDEYSAPEEQERQATRALGDMRVAEAGQQQQLGRQFAGLGIDPSSPAALSARTDVAFRNAAAEAGASTRARDAAKALGMTLASDAANFGRGGASGIIGSSGAAGGASSAGLAGVTGAAATAPGGAGNVNTGLGIARQAYGSNLDAYSSLNSSSITARGAAAAGAAQGIGSGLGLAASFIPGFGGSDRRLKYCATRIATLVHDIGLWSFRYLWEPVTAPLRYGYMADEVEPWFPDAVRVGPGGYREVDNSKVLV